MKKSVRLLAKEVQDALEAEGIRVKVDSATTTGSVYLDLDAELLGTIRISDHKSKGVSHKREIGTHVDSRHTVDKTVLGTSYSIEKFPADQLNALIEAVMIERMLLRARIGIETYAITSGGQDDAGPHNIRAQGRRWKPRARSSN